MGGRRYVKDEYLTYWNNLVNLKKIKDAFFNIDIICGFTLWKYRRF